eukprot:CAMPEP_0202966770 /NCGR_PEP_ID=MMETSP1396-20130829/11325_1 /ASSEMBLY_ACC=CAM_ASM_000872 /TAXON_ID= /ORGANISM="Pseudokeronopsis sp., Strain Brazil" /LENGTH=232 /DNA_ID=CAMNT_0049691009 /DNA_START=1027 /DNA_END=1722 /DNA_ORIENTATION=+
MVAALRDKKVIDVAGGFYHTVLLVKHKKSAVGSKLALDMKKIVNDATRCDITFLVEGKPLHAHRCILFARCSALEERVRQVAKRSDERDRARWGINHPNHSVMEVGGIRYKSFLGLMEYVYTDTVRSLKGNQQEELLEVEQLLDLLSLCIDFRLPKLGQFCREALEPCISVDNCCLLLKKLCDLATHSDLPEGEEALKTACVAFILANFQQVIHQSVFYDLPKHVIKEILQK